MVIRLARIPGMLALAFFLGAPASGQVIEADTTGEDNLADPSYYGVKFFSGGPGGNFLESVSFDISADLDGFFDLDGVTNFAGALEPVVEVSSLVGITAGDISWSFSGNHPNVITANFAPGSFGVGDSFRFGCETDLFVADPCKGGNFATGGAIFSAKLEHGPTIFSNFALVNIEVAIATADASNCFLALSLPERNVKPGESLSADVTLFHNAPWTATTSVHAVVTDPQGKVVVSWKSSAQEIPSGGTLSAEPVLLIPSSAKPGVYRLGVGIGSMRQGITLQSREFVVERAAPAQGKGLQTAPMK